MLSDPKNSGDDHNPIGDVKAKYESSEAYTKTDPWHEYTAGRIRNLIRQRWEQLKISRHSFVLNAGAGSDDFDLDPQRSVHLDIAINGISHRENALLASVEDIPLVSASFHAAVCVGSVINYCDALNAILELSRILKPEGILFLEFESSSSAEYFGRSAFRKGAAIAKTFYGGDRETLWVYSLKYVMDVCQSAGLEVLSVDPVHVISPWLLCLRASPRAATRFAHLDGLLARSGLASRWASNFVLTCRKRSP